MKKKPPSIRWQDLTTEDFANLDGRRTVAVLPVAAVEQHGPHLPLWTDACICNGVLGRALDRLDSDASVLVLPMLPYGLSLEHRDFRGTLSLSAETMIRMLVEIGESVAAAGLRKLALVNSHGGQPQVLDLAAGRLRADRRLLVFRVNVYRDFRDPAAIAEDEIRHGVHAGAIETSIMLHLCPELVRLDRIADFTPSTVDGAKDFPGTGASGPAGFAWQAQDLHVSGAAGDARRADAETGRHLLDRAADALARALAEMSRMPLDVLRDGPARSS